MQGSLTRRAALLGSLAALPGCGIFDDWLAEDKPGLPGKRVSVMAVRRGLEVDPGPKLPVALPRPTVNADWRQVGGVPSHLMGHLQVGDTLAEAWKSEIGAGGGYRAKIMAQPIVSGGRVYTMDSDAVVNAYDVRTGSRLWRLDTGTDDDRNGNVGGGVALSDTTLYASTGRGEMLAIDPMKGAVRWRKPLGTAARSAPTVAEGRLHVATLGGQLVTLSAEDGHRLWAYQASTEGTSVLGLPAPAFSDGTVVAGFGSGDLVALGAASGGVIWADSLASARGRNSISDLSAVHGLPVIADGRVYAIGYGGVMLANDLRSGRRLWERDVASSQSPWVAGDWVFILTTTGQVAALTRAEGRVAWLTQLQQYENEKKQSDPITWIGPVLAGDRLILAASNKVAVAVSPYTGALLGQQDLSGRASVAPSIADGTVFLITDDGALTALR